MTARVLLRLLVLSLFAGSALIVSAPGADASTCWDTGCDGRWPDETSCNNDGYTLTSTSINIVWPPTGQVVSGGTLAVMFSPSCQSQWTLIYAPNCPTYTGGVVCPSYLDIYRWAQGSYPVAVYLDARANGPWYWGRMVGAANAKAESKGCVSISLGGGPSCAYLTA
jgi:hypothetical protein